MFSWNLAEHSSAMTANDPKQTLAEQAPGSTIRSCGILKSIYAFQEGIN
jgi:hypothetical protein